ncbi:glycosyltransferase family 2 protein [Paragemmobacter straminiformis]|uniref:Glycosyltransferase family 2 protein n=1 Tax=Paragemmobacter straminiformis TaxID=2045119 RepID=A0A842I625_9RHOB|nr:glycosyltransferase family 2 protein [Gemmobacter straminiformis]MBC2835031.1 glycosyltransferase family 2 protein [Gemmobacter straminiformis]
MNTNPAWPLDVSIVMPCLNEELSLPHCIANATEALDRIKAEYGLSGEIVIADNGSTDGSQALAASLGARVVDVAEKGYGAAIIGGFTQAQGRFLVMGDADGSYDFRDSVAMIGKLLDGAELCMGSRFKGGIKPGAMPWKNRYIGNPVLTGILNLFFRSGVDDAHCGLRAIRKDTFLNLGLSGTGMEFASEMLIKASLRGVRIDEVPATLSPDLRDRPPHLRPWRDGWRHLRYLLMLSPTWLFGLPAMMSMAAGLALLAVALLQYLVPGTAPQIGSYWTLLGSALVSIGHLSFLLALSAHLYGIRAGYRAPTGVTRLAARVANLETMLLSGLGLFGLGAVILGFVYLQWINRDYQSLANVLLPTLGTLCLTLGMQNMLGGFLLAIIGGHKASFFERAPDTAGPGKGRA